MKEKLEEPLICMTNTIQAVIWDLDGVIIGFVHDPASIIEWVGSNGLGRFGHIKLDPKLKLEPGTPVTITVKPAAPASKD